MMEMFIAVALGATLIALPYILLVLAVGAIILIVACAWLSAHAAIAFMKAGLRLVIAGVKALTSRIIRLAAR